MKRVISPFLVCLPTIHMFVANAVIKNMTTFFAISNRCITHSFAPSQLLHLPPRLAAPCHTSPCRAGPLLPSPALPRPAQPCRAGPCLACRAWPGPAPPGRASPRRASPRLPNHDGPRTAGHSMRGLIVITFRPSPSSIRRSRLRSPRRRPGRCRGGR